MSGKLPERDSRETGDVLFLDQIAGYTGVFSL